jgi:hypothetical protein
MLFPGAGATTDWSEVLAFRDGGLAIFGAVIVGAITVITMSLLVKEDFVKLLDATVPGVMIAQSIGRWGNFVNQEAYGQLVTNPNLQWFPFAVKIEGAFYNATFFYESFWNLIGFIAILLFFRLLFKRYRRGMVLSFYLVWYGLGRLWIEGLRSDSLYLLKTNIKVSQLVSGICILIGLACYVAIYLNEIMKFWGKLGTKPRYKIPLFGKDFKPVPDIAAWIAGAVSFAIFGVFFGGIMGAVLKGNEAFDWLFAIVFTFVFAAAGFGLFYYLRKVINEKEAKRLAAENETTAGQGSAETCGEAGTTEGAEEN